jgi:hypothetical protein
MQAQKSEGAGATTGEKGEDRIARIARVIKIALAIAALLGVGLQFATWNDRLGQFNLFSYFTVQSNLILAFVFLVSEARSRRGRGQGFALAVIERSARLWVYMTGLAFAALLAAIYKPTGLAGLANLLVHLVVPLGTFLEWLLFEPRGCYRLRESIIWVCYPLVYAGSSLFRGGFDGFYPYWFLNPSAPPPDGVGSWPAAILWVGILAIAFFIIGIIITLIDSRLPWPRKGGEGQV